MLLPELDPNFVLVITGLGETLCALMGSCEQIIECREQEEDVISVSAQGGQASVLSSWIQYRQ